MLPWKAGNSLTILWKDIIGMVGDTNTHTYGLSLQPAILFVSHHSLMNYS